MAPMMEPSLKKVNSLFGFADDGELAASGARFNFGLGSDRDSVVEALAFQLFLDVVVHVYSFPLYEVYCLDDTIAQRVLVRHVVRIDRTELDEKLLWVEPLSQRLDVEVLLIDERQIDGGLEVAFGPNLAEFGDGHLTVVGDEPVAVLLDQRVQRHL